MLRLLFLGDIIGEPGRRAVIEMLPTLKSAWELDFVVVNGENVAAGRGITPKLAIDLLRCGGAVTTTGDHVWDQKNIVAFIDPEPRLLRPINYPEGTPGGGSIVLETAKGKVGGINVKGRTFMLPALENHFRRGWQTVRTDGGVFRARNSTYRPAFLHQHAGQLSGGQRGGQAPRAHGRYR